MGHEKNVGIFLCSVLFIRSNLTVPTWAVFLSTDLKFGSFIAKLLKFKTIKNTTFDYNFNCYFRDLAVKYKQSGLSKNADSVLKQNNSVKYENVIIGAVKHNTV